MVGIPNILTLKPTLEPSQVRLLHQCRLNIGIYGIPKKDQSGPPQGLGNQRGATTQNPQATPNLARESQFFETHCPRLCPLCARIPMPASLGYTI